jgi:hypothetical protein
LRACGLPQPTRAPASRLNPNHSPDSRSWRVRMISERRATLRLASSSEGVRGAS